MGRMPVISAKRSVSSESVGIPDDQPWTPNNPLYVYSVGTVHGTSRTIRVASKYMNNTVTWSFASFTGNLISPQTYISNGSNSYNIIAYGYTAASAQPLLGTWNAGT